MAKSKVERRTSQDESGFAVLLVFMMAAAIAIMLYMELPRVSFEAQRDREALLIERGEQYKRAIQLYFRRFKKYPTSLEQLESTNNVRFLHRRYIDPMTGKDEWRMIHISASGAFTDSITRKPQGKDKDGKDTYKNTFITEGPTIGSTLPQAGRASGPPRRPSEQPKGDPNNPDDPNAAAQNLAALAMGQSTGQQVPAQYAGTPLPSQVPANVVPVSPFNLPAQPAQPGAGGIPGAGPIPPASDSSGNPLQMAGGQQPGFNPNQPAGSNQASDLIRNLLTTPRNYPVSPGPGLGTPAVGGGIAGVASTVERNGIKIYNERDKYNEWEFIYDFGKDRTGMGRMAGQMGNADPRLTNGQNQQGGFGNQGAGTGQGGFGAGGFGAQAGQGGIMGAQPGVGMQGGFGAQSGFGQQQTQPQSGQSSSSSGAIGSGYSAPVGSGFDASGSQQPGTPKRPAGQQPPTPPAAPGATQQPVQPVPGSNQTQPPAGANPPPAQGETPPQAPPPPSQPPQ